MIASRDASTLVAYESWEQYTELEEQALKKVQEVTATELLSGTAGCAQGEFNDLAYDTKWWEKCLEALMALTMNHCTTWCEDQCRVLWFVLRQTLLTTLLFVEDDIRSWPEARMHQFPLVHKAAFDAIQTFFEEWIHDQVQDKCFEYIYDEDNVKNGELLPRNRGYMD